MGVRLYFAVHPAKSSEVMILKGEVFTCRKCHKEVVAGRKFYTNGFCYRCEQRRLLSEVYRAEAQRRKLDREYQEVIG